MMQNTILAGARSAAEPGAACTSAAAEPGCVEQLRDEVASLRSLLEEDLAA